MAGSATSLANSTVEQVSSYVAMFAAAEKVQKPTTDRISRGIQYVAGRNRVDAQQRCVTTSAAAR